MTSICSLNSSAGCGHRAQEGCRRRDAQRAATAGVPARGSAAGEAESRRRRRAGPQGRRGTPRQATRAQCSNFLYALQFKKYVNALRGKSSQYKQQRQELAELRAETGVLARTQEILIHKERDLTQTLVSARSKCTDCVKAG